MAAQDAKAFHWHYADADDSNFKLHGHGLALAILLIFSLAILLVVLLCLYIWWACRSPPPASGPAVASGLDAGTIESLPVVLVHRGQALDEEGQQHCSICLGALEEGDKAKVLPVCGHAYHPDCVDAWLRAHSSCPLCRASLGEEDRKRKKVLDAC